MLVTPREFDNSLEPLSASQSGQLVREFDPTTQFDRVTLALLYPLSSGGSGAGADLCAAESPLRTPVP
ncbi:MULTISPECIES: hypothetical protein [unclassified Cryobacterium]|uniref:hypothetical protein n=1 Tax=unclassified Cryobacterium TaxID=2649013 RepID=UPI000CE41879|nr:MULTISPECIES: hypothetical protein [unclassified Cryobacterium]